MDAMNLMVALGVKGDVSVELLDVIECVCLVAADCETSSSSSFLAQGPQAFLLLRELYLANKLSEFLSPKNNAHSLPKPSLFSVKEFRLT